MKFISFNVNGLRSRMHQLSAVISKYDPDVIGLQETKVHDDHFPATILASFGYHLVFHGQKGHYGVALMTKTAPVTIQKGFLCDDSTAQCRLVTVALPTVLGKITVINGYFPQGENRDHPVKYPMKRQFYKDLCQQITTYNQNDLVVIMGDMNIAPTDRDVGISADNQKRWLRAGRTCFLPEERAWIKQIFDLGYCDLFREFNPISEYFSWFDYRSYGFSSNTGLRIDLILASSKLASLCTGTGIDYEIRGMKKPSDHAPIWAEFKLF